jgi:L-asparagine oxygenase
MILTHHAPTTLEVGPFSLPVPTTPALDETFVKAAALAVAALPAALREKLRALVTEGDLSGAFVLRGLPLGAVPATPPTPGAATTKDRTSEFTLITIAKALGEPVGYAPEHGGQIVQNIVPVQASAAKQVSTSSNVALAFHTETAFHPYKPHYLLLLCLRGDPDAATLLCSVSAALDLLDSDTVEVLRQPRFRTRPDASFLASLDALGEFGSPTPILTGTAERPTFTFDADLMTGIDPVAQSAIEALRSAVQQAHLGVVLEAGDLLIVDNHVAVHGRSPFAARYDGTDRWVQRTFVVDELTVGAADRDGRVITTTFR